MFILKQDERIEFIARRHWIIFAIKIFEFVLFMFFGLAIYLGAQIYFDLSENMSNVALFLLTFYLLFIWQGFFMAVTDFYLDTWIATDQRVIDIHQKGFFKRDVSELRYSKIQDITVTVNGFIATIFNYGDVLIQTAGTTSEFVFYQVPNPSQIKDRILKIHDEYIRTHAGEIEVHDNVIS